LFEILGATQRKPISAGFDFAQLAQAALPRLWYLAPQCDFAGMASIMGRD
jgi:hypothetical protein